MIPQYTVIAGVPIRLGSPGRKPKGLPASYYAAESNRNAEQLERADAIIAANAERLAREKAAREAMYAPKEAKLQVLQFPAAPPAAALPSIVTVRFVSCPELSGPVDSSKLRWWSDAMGQTPAFGITRSLAERKPGDVPFLRERCDGEWCHQVEILGGGEA